MWWDSVRVPRFLVEMIFCFSMLMSHHVIFISSKSHYVIVQFTVLYLVVVEGRQRTRAVVSCSAFVGTSKNSVNHNFLLFSQARWSKIAYFVLWSEIMTTAKVWSGRLSAMYCSSKVKEAPKPKRTKCNSFAKVRKWNDTYLRYRSYLWKSECSRYVPEMQE